jgi:two-component system, NtrC family, response regulator
MPEKILIIDDDSSFREVLKFHLLEKGYEVDSAADGITGLQLFKETAYPLVITDFKMPGIDGLTLLKSLLKTRPDTLVIVLTAFGEVEVAVEAMKSGAFDFIAKPFDREHFKFTVEKALEHYRLRATVAKLKEQIGSSGKELLYQSSVMRQIVRSADRVAESDATVMILGESGTGKELLARRIHQKSSRSKGPFVAVNCAAIPRDLLESELFGHAKGAFTGAFRDRTGKFEQANGGTILLDEITDLPLELQPRLLRTIQERLVDIIGKEAPVPVDVRIIAATNQDIDKAVKDGRFRNDLYFRINVFPIEIPPLRKRTEDIPLLTHTFLKKYGEGRSFQLAPSLLKRLESHSWPGNVRELENICHRLVLQTNRDELTEDLLPRSLSPSVGPATVCIDPELELPAGGVSLPDLERKIIVKALEINNYNQSRTARFLGVRRHVLLYRIDKYKIPMPERR